MSAQSKPCADVQEHSPPVSAPVEYQERTIPQAAVDRPPTEEEQVREILGAPREWRWISWNREGDYPNYWGVTIEGGVMPPKTRGKNKGMPNWRKATFKRKFTLTDDQHRNWLADWEHDTGLCHVCVGSGRRSVRWERDTGNWYRDCKRCGATGTAPIPEQSGPNGTDAAQVSHAIREEES